MSDVHPDFTDEEKQFLTTVISGAPFSGPLASARLWADLTEKSLAALESEDQVYPVEVCEFLGFSVEAAEFQGTIQTVRVFVDRATAVIEKLNAALDTLRQPKE